MNGETSESSSHKQRLCRGFVKQQKEMERESGRAEGGGGEGEEKSRKKERKKRSDNHR
jgi:hypothetical protein